jgi:hypothetical protein
MAYPVTMDTHPSLPPELWARTPPAIRAYIETLAGPGQTLTAMVHPLQEQVRTLEERRNHTSRTSSRPPSSDPPQPQRPRRPLGKRRRGGSTGAPWPYACPGAGGRGRCGGRPQTQSVSQLPCALIGRRCLAVSASSHGDAAHQAGDHRVVMASGDLPGVWRDDTRALA